MAGTPHPSTISTKQQRIATLARQMPDEALRTLAHHIDVDWLKEAWRQTRKGGATGIDGETAAAYAQDLEGNLAQLLDRSKSGLYRAPPVRRTYIPKADGNLRPLGIPTFEDKVLQRGFLMLLEPLYETVFLDCSYGFRPGRSAHQALEQLRRHLWRVGGGWVLDVDIRAFFDRMDHGVLRELLQQRVRDGVVIRQIGKWLNAGVMEDGALTRSDLGTPQGGVISPLLANIYLHYAVDEWFAVDVVSRLRGRAHLVRYADDFVMVFQHEDDARRVLEVLPKRLSRFGLEVSPEKTRLVRFGRPSSDTDPPDSFDFLGFTFHWGVSREGRPTIRWKTAKKRLARTLRSFWVYCRDNRHRPVQVQHDALSRKLWGHYQYFGLTMNKRALDKVFDRVKAIWRYWLDRRSQKANMTWQRFKRFSKRLPLPKPQVVHSVFRTG
ncbi:MAG: group II intron reverse transcriptase/maturase [Myxococcota bacterium]